MPTISPPPRRSLVIAVLLSFAVLTASAWLRGGVGATGYDVTDSQGRPMGFNDVFSAEHYSIILKNAGWKYAVEQMGPHDWLLAAFHPVLILLLCTAGPRPIKLFLYTQGAIFYWGWPGLYVAPLALADALFLHTGDREGFVDIPYISMVSQGAWLWTCGFLVWKLRAGAITKSVTRQAAAA